MNPAKRLDAFHPRAVGEPRLHTLHEVISGLAVRTSIEIGRCNVGPLHALAAIEPPERSHFTNTHRARPIVKNFYVEGVVSASLLHAENVELDGQRRKPFLPRAALKALVAAV